MSSPKQINYQCKSPVLFLVFNRPEVTRRVFKAIRAARPSRLYVAADGARADKAGEVERVEEVRSIATQIDWECEIHTLFREENLGCGKAVSQAITWFFENEPEGIILEDDCLPSKAFFRFCDELLEKYRDNEVVAHIGGCNPMAKARTSNTFIFTQYNRIWGWATWARAWKHFDLEIKEWPKIRNRNLLSDIFPKRVSELYTQTFDRCYRGEVDTWDYQWLLCRLRIGLAVCPEANLVSNLGFGDDATHTANSSSRFSDMKVGTLNFPLTTPKQMLVNEKYDREWGLRWVSPSIFQRIINRIFR